MTDYGQFTDDEETTAERRAREERERLAYERREMERTSKEFEAIVLKPRVSCSHNSDMIKFVKHLKNVRTALKAAADDGFCLDEVIDGLKELGNE